MPVEPLGLRITPSGRAAVLGHPITHSLSPVLHSAAYRALGLDWTYEAIDCAEPDLNAVLAARADWAGFSCTMPLKRAALEIAGEVAPLAAAVGSANTLLPGPSGWIADNTDVAGILAALAEHAVAPRTVTVLGAGGTAQAVLAALVALGVGECAVLVRAPSRAAAALDTAARLGLALTLERLAPGAPSLAADLVVSTLPTRAADPFARRDWKPEQVVLDAAYDPWPSALAVAAAGSGARVVSGVLMLLHQAAAQVSLMTGFDAPVEEMRLALNAVAPDSGL